MENRGGQWAGDKYSNKLSRPDPSDRENQVDKSEI